MLMQQSVHAQKAQVARGPGPAPATAAYTRAPRSYLTRRKAAQPPLAALLNELTACLPPDTWIDQLEVNDGADVSFSGQSAKASALITRIKNCRSLENAQVRRGDPTRCANRQGSVFLARPPAPGGRRCADPLTPRERRGAALIVLALVLGGAYWLLIDSWFAGPLRTLGEQAEQLREQQQRYAGAAAPGRQLAPATGRSAPGPGQQHQPVARR